MSPKKSKSSTQHNTTASFTRTHPFTTPHRTHITATTKELRSSLSEKSLPETPPGVLRLLADSAVQALCAGINTAEGNQVLHDVDVYAYLAVLLYSNVTGFSLHKALSILSHHAYPLDQSTLTSFREKLLHFPYVNSNPAAYQRSIDEFLSNAFKPTKQISFPQPSTFCTFTNIDTRTTPRAHATQLDLITDTFLGTILHIRPVRQTPLETLSTFIQTLNLKPTKHLVITLRNTFARKTLIRSLFNQNIYAIAFNPPKQHTEHPVTTPSSRFAPQDSSDDEEKTSDTVTYPRRSEFVLRRTANHANTTVLKHTHDRQLTTLSVREFRERPVLTNVVYNLPMKLSKSMNSWVTIPDTQTFERHLFRRDQQSRIINPTGEGFRDELERYLLQNCSILTTARGTADWALLRKFRVTAEIACRVYMNSVRIREMMKYPPRLGHCEECVEGLCEEWFNNHDMGIVTRVEDTQTVLDRIRGMAFVRAVFEVGLLGHKNKPWLACSPDAVCVVDTNHVPERFPSNSRAECVVLINTNVSSEGFDRNGENIVCGYDDPALKECVPEDDVGRMIHCALVAKLSTCLYVAADGRKVLYSVLFHFADSVVNAAEVVAENAFGEFVKWSYDDSPRVPDAFDKDLVQGRLQFWKLVNDSVTNNGPCVPVKEFRHSMHLLSESASADVLSKLCGGSVVTDVFNTLAVNAFIGWRLLQKDLPTVSLDGIDFDTFPDFVHDLTTDLLKQRSPPSPQVQVTRQEQDLPRLTDLASNRKRHRLLFFNTPDGVRLRTGVVNHPHQRGEADIYCALCGQNKGEFRGYRSGVKCGYCHVNLCVKEREGVSCWDLWHAQKCLERRVVVGKRRRVEK